MKNTKIVSIVIVCLGLFIIFGNNCFATGELYQSQFDDQRHFNSIGQLYLDASKCKELGLEHEFEVENYIKENYACDNVDIDQEGSGWKVKCGGHSETSGIAVINNIKYHFCGKVVEFPITGFQSQANFEAYISTNYGCNQADINTVSDRGNTKFIVKCKGHSASSFGSGFDASVIPTGDDVEEIKTPIGKVANTVILILQVLTVGGIIVTGIRYMFVGADAKTEIKKTLPFLIIGIIIVFAGPVVIEFITQVFSEMI